MFIAGATTIGQVAAKVTAVNMLSAKPAAIFAIVLAVAGAIKTISALVAKDIWEMLLLSSKISILTGCPDKASKVDFPTSFVAASVMQTYTSAPPLIRRRQRVQAL